MSKITAFKCHNCNGMGRVSYETLADEDADLGASIISRPCDVCNGSSAQYKSNWNDIFGKPAKAEEKSKSNKTKGSKDEKGKGN